MSTGLAGQLDAWTGIRDFLMQPDVPPGFASHVEYLVHYYGNIVNERKRNDFEIGAASAMSHWFRFFDQSNQVAMLRLLELMRRIPACANVPRWIREYLPPLPHHAVEYATQLPVEWKAHILTLFQVIREHPKEFPDDRPESIEWWLNKWQYVPGHEDVIWRGLLQLSRAKYWREQVDGVDAAWDYFPDLANASPVAIGRLLLALDEDLSSVNGRVRVRSRIRPLEWRFNAVAREAIEQAFIKRRAGKPWDKK
jgi:hypothetical protein